MQILSREGLLAYAHPTVHSNWQRTIIPSGRYFQLVEINELYCVNSAAKAVSVSSRGFQHCPLLI